MNGKEVQSNLGPPALTGGARQDAETHAERAEHWLNLCNFTNLQQKLQLLKNDPQWAVTYEQLQLDPQLLLKTYRLPGSQLQKNWQTYVELVERAGDPTTMINEQVPSTELLRRVQARVEQVLLRLQARLDAFPPESTADDGGDKDQAKKENQRVDLREGVAYGLFNVISAYAVYDPAVDICSTSRRFIAEEQGKYGAELGLCQLMACILYHTRDEVSSFWIAVSLVEYYDMRQFYQRGLPGLTLYGEVLGALLEKHLPELNQVLNQHEITYLDFFEEWATSHFLNQMPVDLSLQCLAEFLREGWPFFFRLCLSVLKSMQHQIFELGKANQQKPLRQKLAHHCVSEQILSVLNFQEPRTDYKPEHAAIPDDISAMENFKNMNESANALSGHDAAENFLDLEDEQKQFDNNFAIVDSKPRKQEVPAQSSQNDSKSRAKVKAKVSKIVVNRERQQASSRSRSEGRIGLGQESAEGQRGVGGLFRKFKDMIGLSKEDQKKQAQKMEELKRIQSLLGSSRSLMASDFVRDSRRTWAYLLEIVKYEWIVPEKQEALCAPNGASSSMNGLPEQIKPENLDALLAPEFQRDYQVSKDVVQQLLAQKQNIALRKFLDWQKRLQEKERDQMMEKARREQLEAAQHQPERKESERPTSGQSAGQEISEGTQGGPRSQKPSPSRDRAERHKPGTPLLSYGAGQSIVQFDALNSSKNGGHGAFGNRKASYTGSVFNHPRGSIQSTDAFKPPVESYHRYSGPAASNLGVSLNLDFAASVAGGHIVGSRPVQGIAPGLLGAGAGSQAQGVGGYPGLFNEADVSMMDEMNKLLMGLGGAGIDQDLRQRGSQRAQKSSTPTPHLPPSNLHVADSKAPKASVSPVPPKVPVTVPAQRNSAGNPGAQAQTRQSYGGSSSCIKSSKFDREEQDDLIIGGGGIGVLPAKAQARNSVTSHNLSRVSQFAHMENLSKIEMKQEEAYDTFGDVSLQKCLQLGQLSFQHRNSERYQASLQQQSMIKNERPQNILNGQEQFRLNLQKIDDQADPTRGQRQLRAIDEQPSQHECTPNKLMTGQRPLPVAAFGSEGSPFRSPVSDHSKTGFGNDQFNFKDTSQITTGERNNVHAMDMRERCAGPSEDDPDNVRPERDKTKERPVDQYVSPQTAAKTKPVGPATPAWKQAPTQSQHKDRQTKLDFQRRQLAAYQQQNQPASDATLMIVPDKAGQSSDSVGLISPLQKQMGVASRFDQLDPRDQARITSPLATKQAVPQSTPGFARQVNPQPQFSAPHTPTTMAQAANSSNKIQIHCMPQTKKRNYFDNNFGSFGGANALPGPGGATKPATLHGQNTQLLKQKPLSIKSVTPMKLLMLTGSPQRRAKPNQAEEKEKVPPGENPTPTKGSHRRTASKGGAPVEATRTDAVMQGKRTNNMQRQSAMEDLGRGATRAARPSARVEPTSDRDRTPVIAESRHRGRHLKKFPAILSQASATNDHPPKREISKIIVAECHDYVPGSGDRQLDSMDQVGSPQDHVDRSKMERSALGTSANDSKRSLKKNLSMSKNLSRSIKNLKHDEITAVLNFQGVRQDNNLQAQAKDERPLSPMFNGAQEARGRPDNQLTNGPMSPPGHGGSAARRQGGVHAHDPEHLAELPSPIRSADRRSDGVPKQEETAVPVLVSQPPLRTPEPEPQQNSVMSAKQQAIKEKMMKIQEMKKQQKNKLGNNSTFGGGGENQTRVSHADRTNVQNNSSKSLGLGLNASSSLIFGRGGCNSSKNNLNNTNQSQEAKLAFQLNQSKMTNRSKNSAQSSSCSNKLKNMVSNQLAGKQPSLNFEHYESPGAAQRRKKTLRGVGEGEAVAIDIGKPSEPRKSLSAPKSERKSFRRRLASGPAEGEGLEICSQEQQQRAMLAEEAPQQVLDLDREIEKELKRLTEGDPEKAMRDLSGPQAMLSPEHSGLGLAAQPRGSGNDMNFWFGEQQAAVQARGSGNDPEFRNLMRPQKENQEPANDSFQLHKSSTSRPDKDTVLAAHSRPPTDTDLTSEPKPRSSSTGIAMDPRQKQKKVKAIQDFINNAKKNKFSEWRKLKQQNQTQSSDNQSQGR